LLDICSTVEAEFARCESDFHAKLAKCAPSALQLQLDVLRLETSTESTKLRGEIETALKAAVGASVEGEEMKNDIRQLQLAMQECDERYNASRAELIAAKAKKKAARAATKQEAAQAAKEEMLSVANTARDAAALLQAATTATKDQTAALAAFEKATKKALAVTAAASKLEVLQAEHVEKETAEIKVKLAALQKRTTRVYRRRQRRRMRRCSGRLTRTTRGRRLSASKIRSACRRSRRPPPWTLSQLSSS
jgi:predicted  nucleic acid-binding Zn-ribbon protein